MAKQEIITFVPNFLAIINLHSRLTRRMVMFGMKQTLNLLIQDSMELMAPLIDLQVIQYCVSSMKNNKAPGHDGICSDSV